MKKIIIFISVFLIILITGCSSSSKGSEEPVEVEIKTEEPVKVNVIEVKEENVIEPVKEQEVKIEEEKFYSKLTGEEIEEKNINNRAFAVMLDNLYSARPQAGLSQADIVYEILVEGSITRYMAVFQSEYPNNIGPVRSARPYFVKKSLEFDAFYTHVGGSPQGLKDIKRLNLYDINAMSCGADIFWRVDHKKIPHNMYTSSDAILKEANRKKYKTNGEIEFLDFYKDNTKINGENGNIIKIRYKEPIGKDLVGYTSEYRYDIESGLYYRYTNSEKYIDENNKEELTVKNILVQFAKTRVVDDKLRREIDIVGTGQGLYFTNGEYIEVTWEKKTESSRTIFYSNGEEIKLNVGKTWIQVVPYTLEVKIN